MAVTSAREITTKEYLVKGLAINKNPAEAGSMYLRLQGQTAILKLYASGRDAGIT